MPGSADYEGKIAALASGTDGPVGRRLVPKKRYALWRVTCGVQLGRTAPTPFSAGLVGPIRPGFSSFDISQRRSSSRPGRRSARTHARSRLRSLTGRKYTVPSPNRQKPTAAPVRLTSQGMSRGPQKSNLHAEPNTASCENLDYGVGVVSSPARRSRTRPRSSMWRP